MTANPLQKGLHFWAYGLPTEARVRVDTARAKALGISGLIYQSGLGAPSAMSRVSRELVSGEVQVTCGLGMDGSSGHKNNLSTLADSIVACLAQTRAVMLNWEGRWDDEVADKARAAWVSARVLEQVPEASLRCVDAPWWAPLSVRRGARLAPTHPHAPTVEFGALARWRFVQAYGANVKGSPDGMSTKMLAWARDPSQYPSLGIPADRVLPSYQAYYRSVTDFIQTMLADEVICMWHLSAINAECKAALLCVQALKAQGFGVPGGDAAFQRSKGLKGPSLWGPVAYRALLGKDPPSGIRWYRSVVA